MMTKDARVLNTNATKFEVLLYASEREELSEAQAGADGAEKSLKGRFLQRWARYNAGLHRTNKRDNTVRGAIYIVWLELCCRVHNRIRAGLRNEEPIGE